MITRTEIRVAASAALLMAAACSHVPSILPPPASTTPGTTSTTISALESEVHELINRRRGALGLSLLTADPVLNALAREHSTRMALGEVAVGHDAFEDRFDRAHTALAISRMAENVASNSGYPAAAVPQQMVDGWIRSPRHRASLEGDFRLTGVGIARSATGEFFGTQLFAD